MGGAGGLEVGVDGCELDVQGGYFAGWSERAGVLSLTTDDLSAFRLRLDEAYVWIGSPGRV